MRSFWKRIGAGALALMAGVGLARAETIMVNSSLGGIYLVEVETLTVTEIAQAPQFFDIAISPKGDILGITGHGQIWQVDPEGTNLPLARVGVFINALEFDRKGALIGAGNDWVVGISATNGATQLIGRYPGFASSGDMTFGPSGELYATGSPGPAVEDTLFRMDGSGGLQPVGPIGFRNVYGMVWSSRLGVLLGVTEARELIVIDRATGAGRLLGVMDFPGLGYGAAGMGGDVVVGSLDRR